MQEAHASRRFAVTGWQAPHAVLPSRIAIWVGGLALGHLCIGRDQLVVRPTRLLRILSSPGFTERRFQRANTAINESGTSDINFEGGFLGAVVAPIVVSELGDVKLRVRVRDAAELLTQLAAQGWDVRRYTRTKWWKK